MPRNVAQLVEAVRAEDVAAVRDMLTARPELVHTDMAADDERRALHVAVLRRSPLMARLLMQHGADARKGIYPHRDATTPLAIATDREYDEIVAIILEEETRRVEQVTATHPGNSVAEDIQRARTAVAQGDVGWLRARHADGILVNASAVNVFSAPPGLLTTAVTHDRADILALLLEWGFAPDEPMRVEGLDEPEYSQGTPLWHSVAKRQFDMAAMLLERGANPNAQVYASGSPVHVAYRQDDRRGIELLERYGGAPDAITAGMCGRTALAVEMLAGRRDGRVEDGVFAGRTVAEQLLWGAADGGHSEIVRMALEQVDWRREDPRWHRVLWRPFPGHAARAEPDRERYLSCLRLLLDRADPNVTGTFGRTLLHDIAARGMPEEQVPFAAMLLDAGARLDVRDHLLESTPLGWACRWGRLELVKLLLARGADPVEANAAPWAAPRAWAGKKKQSAVVALLSR